MTGKTIPQELRHQAEQMRRAAAVPTAGGRRVDRILLQLAQELEAEAARREREAAQ